MSFVSWKDNMKYGDLVLMFFRRDKIVPVKLGFGESYETPMGRIKHEDLVGKPYGSRIYFAEIQKKYMEEKDGSPPRGFVLALHPTCSLWMGAVVHRTQILFENDVAYICYNLDLKPGDKVCEAGTGSGALTTALARYIAPNGKVYTHEFHETRKNKAEEEFQRNGISHLIDITHRDVIADGFILPDDTQVDAVVLDLPSPWEVVTNLKSQMKSGSKICSFSPCIEQVQKMVNELMKEGFVDLETAEVQFKKYEIQHTHFVSLEEFIEESNTNKKRKRRKSVPKKLAMQSAPTTQSSNTEERSIAPIHSFSRQYSDLHYHTGYLTFAVWYTD